MLRLKSAGCGPNPGQAYSQMRFPTDAGEVLQMRGERDCFILPAVEPKQCADPYPAEPCGMRSLGGGEPPVEVAFGAGNMQLCISLPMISFLIHHQSLRP